MKSVPRIPSVPVASEKYSAEHSPQTIQFRKMIYSHWHQNPRGVEMPWREDYNPYHVLLSEFMLQQTQVSRVVEYFNKFCALWPRVEQLATEKLSNVLFHWQGLGYNRRGKFLHACAQQIVEQHGAQIPQDYDTLFALPGIGTYTASAILAFAYNLPSVVVETNIRRVVIHHFFCDAERISELEIRQKVAELLDKDNPRIWYWAMMDYGAYLTKKVVNPNRKSKIYRKQSKFEGSNRQVRSTIMKVLLQSNESVSKSMLLLQIKDHLAKELEKGFFDDNLERTIDENIFSLAEEGLIASEKNSYYIP